MYLGIKVLFHTWGVEHSLGIHVKFNHGVGKKCIFGASWSVEVIKCRQESSLVDIQYTCTCKCILFFGGCVWYELHFFVMSCANRWIASATLDCSLTRQPDWNTPSRPVDSSSRCQWKLHSVGKVGPCYNVIRMCDKCCFCFVFVGFFFLRRTVDNAIYHLGHLWLFPSFYIINF